MEIICLFIKSYWRTLKRKHSARAAKCLKDYSYKAYILRKKYTRMFVFGHYLFLEALRHSLFASWNRECPRINIPVYFYAK